jgi:hypothetical protein
MLRPMSFASPRLKCSLIARTCRKTKPTAGCDRQHRGDPRQRGQDQSEHPEDFDSPDDPDDRHRHGVHPAHHRRELLPPLREFLPACVEVEQAKHAGDDPVRDDHEGFSMVTTCQ